MLPDSWSAASSGMGSDTVLAAHARALELGPVIEYISQATKSGFSGLDYRGDKPHSFWPRPASSLTCTQPSRCAENEKEERDIRVSLQAL